MKTSTVTAIVSAYYAESFLEGRLSNLLSQAPVPEVIVVCQDGSIEHKIATKFADVVVITTPDVPTIYRAWNIGVEAAHGEYLTNANCDDRLYPGALRHLAGILDDNPQAGIAYANSDIVTTIDGLPVNRFEWLDGGFAELQYACFVGPMPMWRKELHSLYGLFDEELRVAGDYDFWLRVVSQGQQLRHSGRSVGAYLRRPDSAEHRESLRTLVETARVRSRYTKGVSE